MLYSEFQAAGSISQTMGLRNSEAQESIVAFTEPNPVKVVLFPH